MILQGGTNDGWDNAPVGEMTAADKKTGFDPSTFAGGLETLFSYAKRSFSYGEDRVYHQLSDAHKGLRYARRYVRLL